jgi:hypothetical protein
MMRILFLIFLSISFIESFNVSPRPNIILQNPIVNKIKSSYFGFSVNLRKTHVLVGAPKANSTLPLQKNLIEPGLIYKCSFNEICKVLEIDIKGDQQGNPFRNIPPERKDFRLLGYSIDGHENENDNFVACAPRELTNNNEKTPEMYGACYVAQDTKENNKSVTKVMTFRELAKGERKTSYYDLTYGYGECGFSAHIPDDKDEFIAGCPGYYYWKGSVTQFDFKTYKRNQKYSGVHAATNLISDRKSLPTYSYLGFAVTIGKFLMPHKSYSFYVASAPTIEYTGSVFIFDQISNKNFVPKLRLNGDKYGSYFGYALLTDDFNDDKRPDLVVSAPFYSQKGIYDNGAVYVYMNQASNGNVSNFKKLFEAF